MSSGVGSSPTRVTNFKTMQTVDKYHHIGYSHPSVNKGWKPIVEKAIIDIEKEMWPSWIPMVIKRWIHYRATGNNSYKVKNRMFFKLRTKLTGDMMVTQIFVKFAFLCIYLNRYDNQKIQDIISQAEFDCSETCEFCGYKHDEKNKVERTTLNNWTYNICEQCIKDKKYIRVTWD